MKPQTVIGIFDYGVDAQMAAQQLMNNGISENNIDVAVRGATDRTGAPATANETRTTDNKDKGFFDSLFDNRDDSGKYSEVAQHGSVVAVHTQSETEAKKAAELLDKYGAIDVEDRAEKYKAMPKDKRQDWIQSSIPVVQEELKVGKREVETGGLSIKSRIIEKPVEEHLRLREEHVRVERQPVNRLANEKDMATFKKGETKVIEHAEVPQVSKEARVVEEVKLGKEVSSREETIKDTLRKKDVEIDEIRKDKLNKDNMRGSGTK